MSTFDPMIETRFGNFAPPPHFRETLEFRREVEAHAVESGQADVLKMEWERLRAAAGRKIASWITEGRQISFQFTERENQGFTHFGRGYVLTLRAEVTSNFPLIELKPVDPPDWRPPYSVSEDHYAANL